MRHVHTCDTHLGWASVCTKHGHTQTRAKTALYLPLSPLKHTHGHTLNKFHLHRFSYTLEIQLESLGTRFPALLPLIVSPCYKHTGHSLACITGLMSSQTALDRINRAELETVKQKGRIERDTREQHGGINIIVEVKEPLALWGFCVEGGLKTCR